MEKKFELLNIETLNLNLLDIRNSDISLLLSGLTIYAETKKEIDFCSRHFILAVIGESHFILVEGEFFELLVCKILPSHLFAGILSLDQKFGEDLNLATCHYQAPGFNYYFKCRFIDYWQKQVLTPEGKLIHFCEEEFPFIFYDEEIPCKTQLCLSQTNARTLCLKTRHDYPAPDGISVLTKSIWNFPKIGSL